MFAGQGADQSNDMWYQEFPSYIGMEGFEAGIPPQYLGDLSAGLEGFGETHPHIGPRPAKRRTPHPKHSRPTQHPTGLLHHGPMHGFGILPPRPGFRPGFPPPPPGMRPPLPPRGPLGPVATIATPGLHMTGVATTTDQSSGGYVAGFGLFPLGRPIWPGIRRPIMRPPMRPHMAGFGMFERQRAQARLQAMRAAHLR
jgi:hypothetical protein